MSARTKIRRRALDVLFEADAKGVGSDPESLRALAAQRGTQMVAQVTLPPYAARMVRGVADHLRTIDGAIREFSRGWTLERMPSVDRAALRLGTWEIWYNDEVDAPVTINEMVGIVAELSTDRSPRFVNGVLDTISRTPRPIEAELPDEVETPDHNAATEVEGQGESDAPDELDALDAAWAEDAPLPAPEGMELAEPVAAEDDPARE